METEATPAPHSLHPSQGGRDKKLPKHLLPPEHPQNWKEHLPWTEDVPSSLFSVPGEEAMLPRGPTRLLSPATDGPPVVFSLNMASESAHRDYV